MYERAEGYSAGTGFDAYTAGTPVWKGVSGILCAGPGFHQVLTKRSPNMMANWVLASAHSRGGIFHC